MICARSRSLALVVVSYNCRSSVTWVSDKGGRVRGVAIVPFSKDGPHYTTPSLYRKYFLEAFSIPDPRWAGLRRGTGEQVAVRILLANSKVPKWVCPTRLLGRQKRLG